MTEEDKNNPQNLWCHHKRESWIRYTPETWVEYPFQNHFYTCKDTQLTKDCVDGILEANHSAMFNRNKPLSNFQDWIDRVFGRGLAKHFMNPYNFKVWAYPPSEMNSVWVGERVATVDLNKTVDNIISQNEKKINPNASWGPNSTFKFPKYGGTGSIWRGVGGMLDQNKLMLNTNVSEIDTTEKLIKFDNSNTIQYDYLINTIPIDLLMSNVIKPTKELDVEKIFSTYGKPLHSSTNVIGIGLNGKPPSDMADKSWMYFHTDRSPFYRSTVLSNYSPYMVRETGKQWSLMLEVSESPNRPLSENIVEESIQGLLNEKLIKESDVDDIASKWYLRMEYGYPTPYLKRNQFLDHVEPILRKSMNIYSRGRFGGWKYEVSNQDHSCMQGVESVDNILYGCEEQTFFYPDHVNTRKESTRRLNL
jgi:protoporphyrinogen oxidase